MIQPYIRLLLSAPVNFRNETWHFTTTTYYRSLRINTCVLWFTCIKNAIPLCCFTTTESEKS